MKALPKINLYYKIMLNISDYMQGRNSAYWKHQVVFMISVLMLLNLHSVCVLVNRLLLAEQLVFNRVYMLVAGIVFVGLLVFNYRCFYRSGVYEQLRRNPATLKYSQTNHYILYLITSIILCVLSERILSR